MARNKNALRKHYVQAYIPGIEAPDENAWLELAQYISNIGDDTSEEVDTEAYYSGDGTPEQSVTSVAGAYTPEGYYDPSDPAQRLIAGMKYKTGDGRKVWHKVVAASGSPTYVGKATVTDIVAGAGDANAFEAFSCNIKFDQIPDETVSYGSVKFTAKEDKTGVKDVVITIGGETYTTDDDGEATVDQIEYGTYVYTVAYPDDTTGPAVGSVTVADTTVVDITINVTSTNVTSTT